MRILMTADTAGGVWTYALDLIKALNTYEAQVDLATMGEALSPAQRTQVGTLPNVIVHENTGKLEWMQNPWDDVDRCGQWLLDLERKTRPGIVHLNNFAHGALPWRTPTVVVGHSCVCSWWEAVHKELPPPEWREYRERVQQGLAHADLVVAPSRHMLGLLRRHYSFNGPARVIYNGRDAAEFPACVKQPAVFSAGRLWDAGKNVAALAAVAPEISWPVFVAGEGLVANEREHHSNLHVLGKLPNSEIVRWMACSSIYAAPAVYEPFGLSILEAAFCGCALVLGDIPSLREIWQDAAAYIEPQNQAALGQTLQRLIEDPSRIQDLAARARRRAALFSSRRFGRRYMQTYAGMQRRWRSNAVNAGEEGAFMCAS